MYFQHSIKLQFLTGHKPPRKQNFKSKKGAETTSEIKNNTSPPRLEAKQWPGASWRSHSQWLQGGTSSRTENTCWIWAGMGICFMVAAFQGAFFIFTKDVNLVKGCQEQFLPAEGAVNTQWNAKWRFMLQYDSNQCIPPVTFARFSSSTILVN